MAAKSDVLFKLRTSEVWKNLWEVDSDSSGGLVFRYAKDAGDVSPEIRISYRPTPNAVAPLAFVFTEEHEESPDLNEGVHSMLMMSSNFMNWLANSFSELSDLHQKVRPMNDAFEVQWGSRPLEVLPDTAGRFGLG